MAPKASDKAAYENATKALDIARSKAPDGRIKILSTAMISLTKAADDKAKSLQFNILRARAWAYIDTKDFSRAKDDAVLMNRIKPRHYAALEILAQLYENGDKKKAKTCYEAAIKSIKTEKGPQLDAKALDHVRRLEKRMESLTWVDPFQRLPVEVLLNIFEYIDFQKRLKFMRVSKEWNSVLSIPPLWQHLDFTVASWRKLNSPSRSAIIRGIGRAKGACKSLKLCHMLPEDQILILAYIVRYNKDQIEELELSPEASYRRSAVGSILLKLVQFTKLRRLKTPYACLLSGISLAKNLTLPSSLRDLDLWDSSLGDDRHCYLHPGMLGPNVSRLVFDGRDADGRSTALGLSDQEFSELKEIHLTGVDLLQGRAQEPPVAPPQHTNNVQGVLFEERFTWRPDLYRRLEKLVLSSSSWTYCINDSTTRSLGLPQGLKHFALEAVRMYSRPPGNDPLALTYDFSQLKTFHWVGCDGDSRTVNAIFEALYTPSESKDASAASFQGLISLTLRNFNPGLFEYSLIPDTPLRHFLEPILEVHGRTLTRLEIGFLSIEDETVKRVGSLCPVLETLIIHQPQITGATIGGLIRSLSGKLRSLELNNCPALQDDTAELKAFGLKHGVEVKITQTHPRNEGRSITFAL